MNTLRVLLHLGSTFGGYIIHSIVYCLHEYMELIRVKRELTGKELQVLNKQLVRFLVKLEGCIDNSEIGFTLRV